MKKRVLIGYADYGTSHKMVAFNLFNFLSNKKDIQVILLNLSDYSNDLGKLTNDVFYKANKKVGISGIMYGITNNKTLSKGNIKLCIKAYDNDKLRDFFSDFKPDIVISTHFYMNFISAYYKSEKVINSNIISVITDFSSHSWWICNSEDINYYIVDNLNIKKKLISNGISSEKVLDYGIPYNNDLLNELENRDIVLKKYSIKGERPVILFFAGGEIGRDSSYDYFKSLVKSYLNIDIIFISGYNKELKKKCEDFVFDNSIKNTLVLGFTKDILNIMNSCDVIITTPGSYILNEIMVLKKPSILLPGVGGIEIRNAKYMCSRHFSIKVSSHSGLVKKIKSYLNYPFIINSMKNKLDKLEVKNSCEEIYKLVKTIEK